MYKKAAILGLLTLVFSCSQSIEVPETSEKKEVIEPAQFMLDTTQRPVLFDFTSTGCPGCGSWGKPTFNSFADEYENKIVPMAVHIKYGDPMITPISEALANNRIGAFYTPQLWVNNKNGMVLSGNSINGTASIENIRAVIENKIADRPEIAVGVSGVINETTIQVRLKTKNLEELDGEFYKAIYIVENGISHNQSSSASNPTKHDYVIREMNNEYFGKAFSTSEFSKDFENEEILTFELNSSWESSKLGVSAIIWKKIGATFYVVNAFYKKIEN